ncbi:MAG: CDP-glycerol glycerophosphotransferase family protein [Gammaproteobacteria bacterium]
MPAAKRYLFYISQNYSFAILRPVQKAVQERGGDVAWFVEGDAVNADFFSADDIRLPSVDAIYDFNPDAILYPANTAPTFLPGINVAVFHGFDAGKVDRKGRNDHFKVRNCFDLYCTQGPSSTRPFEALQEKHPHFRIAQTGWCALDSLFQALPPAQENPKRRILMCSTFSKKLSCARVVFEKVKALSATGRWQWTIQFHPKMERATVELYKSIESEHLTFVETSDVIPLLQDADIMLCDTSSVLIMFALLQKPIVTFNNVQPQDYMINVTHVNELERALADALSYPPAVLSALADFAADTHPLQDGQSSGRVLDAIDATLADPPARKKPRDLVRQFKMRKKLNYWKLR